MKKIYSTPEVAIVNVELQSVMAVGSGFSPNEVDELPEEVTSGNMGRSGSLWDEED